MLGAVPQPRDSGRSDPDLIRNGDPDNQTLFLRVTRRGGLIPMGLICFLYLFIFGGGEEGRGGEGRGGEERINFVTEDRFSWTLSFFSFISSWYLLPRRGRWVLRHHR